MANRLGRKEREMANIEKVFNSHFAHWDITLPSSAMESRQVGKIIKAGWTIWYLSGSDGETEYLDYYAMHRMTDDSHVRIRSNGETEGLETVREFRVSSKDPEEDKRLAEEFFDHNRKVHQMLEAKGFSFQGDEHGSAQVNRYLLTTPPEER